AFAARVRRRPLGYGCRRRDRRRKKKTGAAEKVWCWRCTEALFPVARRSSRRLDRVSVEIAPPPSRCVRDTTARPPRLRRQRADETRPQTGTSARGESAAHFGPGNGLDGTAIELGDAAVHLGRPGGFSVLVHLGVKAL